MIGAPTIPLKTTVHSSTRTSTREARDASARQFLYTNSLVHDLFYCYGFDDVSGSFQQRNFNGGKGNDAVIANAQDGGGFNNDASWYVRLVHLPEHSLTLLHRWLERLLRDVHLEHREPVQGR